MSAVANQATVNTVLDVLAAQVVDGLRSAVDNVPVETASKITEADVVVTKGDPSDAEIAALVAVLAAASAAAQHVSHSPMSPLCEWGTPTELHRYGLGNAPTVFVNARYSR